MKLRRVPYVTWMVLMVSAMVLPGGLFGEFAFEQPKVEIRIIPDYNHFPVRVGISTELGKECLGRLKVKSDAGWVTPSIDLETEELVLSLDTLRLFNKKYTATIRGELDGSRSQVIVEAVIVGMEIRKMEEDPFRPRVYAISAPKDTLGSLFDSNLNILWSIGEEIQSVSPDGKWAFGLKQIYNLQTRKAIQSMPPKAQPNTYNPITRKLVLQEGEGIGFLEIPSQVN